MTPQEKSVNERSNEEVAQKIFNESGINGIVLKDPRILIKEALDAKDAEITRLTKEINASRILYDQYRTGAKSEYSIYEAKLADSEKKLAEVKEENERLRSALGVDHTVWCASLQDKYDTLKSQLAEMVEVLKSMTEKQPKREGSKLFNKDLIIHTASPNEHPDTGEAIAECYICSALNSVGK